MPQTDKFANYSRGLNSPATQQFTIAPQDAVDLPIRPRFMRVTQGGTLALRDDNGTVLTYQVLPGETVWFSPRGVEASGTSAEVVGWQ